MTHFDKLELICNFKEEINNTPQPIRLLSYITWEDSGDISDLKKKSKKRNIIISDLLGEVLEEDDQYIDYEDMSAEIYPKVLSTNIISQLIPNNICDLTYIYDKVISLLEKNTKVHDTKNKINCDITYDNNDTYESNLSKMMRNMSKSSTIINMNSRNSTGNSNIHIIGENVLNKYPDIISNNSNEDIIIITNNNIDPDKVITCLGGCIDGSGIDCIYNKSEINSVFYLKELENWNMKYNWFWVK